MRRSWLFKFDWFMKTRETRELGQRVETLAKLLEAEQKAEAAREKRAGKAGSKRPLEEPSPPSRKR